MAERMSLLRSIEVAGLDKRLYRVCFAPEDERFMDAPARTTSSGARRVARRTARPSSTAISLFDSAGVARQLARRVPKLGGHIATIDLRPGLGICVAKTGGPAHWSVWGRPAQLAACCRC